MTVATQSSSSTSPEIMESARKIAELRGVGKDEALAQAWREYLDRHRDQFRADLAEASRLVRNGCGRQLAEHASRFAEQRAEALANRAAGAVPAA